MSNPTDNGNEKKGIHQTQVAGKQATATPVTSSNTLVVRADFGVWDSVANKFVLVDQTTFGTKNTPKNQ